MYNQPNMKHPMLFPSAANPCQGCLQHRVLLTPVEAGAACGWAKQTVYNKRNDDEFPIPLVEFGGRPMVRTVDLIEYIENLQLHSTSASVEARRVGRPTKAESIRRKSNKSEVAE